MKRLFVGELRIKLDKEASSHRSSDLKMYRIRDLVIQRMPRKPRVLSSQGLDCPKTFYYVWMGREKLH
jgi:hypothetical protein